MNRFLTIRKGKLWAVLDSLDQPTSSVTVETYRQHGFLFYAMYGEPTTVAGNFDLVKSIVQLQGIKDPSVNPSIVDISGPNARLTKIWPA